MSQPGQPVGGGTNQKGKFNWVRLIISLISIAIFVILILWMTGVFDPQDETWTYSELLKQLADGLKVEKWSVSNSTIILQTDAGRYVVSVGPSFVGELQKFVLTGTGGPFPGLEALTPELYTGYQPPVGRSAGDAFLEMLIGFLPMILIFGGLFWVLRRAGGGAGMGEVFSGGKNQARKVISRKRFTDVAGQKEVKEEVSEVVDFLKKPGKYRQAGARVPKGIMLGGPPGTGKTLVAKAVAGEAGVPFYFISASNFVEMFAGLGAKRVREMFKEARKAAPAILFIDELDAVGRKRGSSLSGNDEREQTLNQILVEMDGMDENSGLLIIAATNRPDVLDPALLRPGRFDRTITVGMPDIKERQAILELHARGKRVSPSVDFGNIAKRTPRFSGAQLENVINEAALLSVRENSDVILLSHIDEAIDRVTAGPAKKHRVITEKENRMIAVHEAGHAVVGLKVEGADIVQKITIIPRGDAGGYTLMTPKKEQYTYSRSQLEAMIVAALGGRAAEQVQYGVGEVSTGASNDIEKATAIARAMVTQYGMSHLGPIAYEKAQGSQYLGQERVKEYSDALAERIDEAIRQIIVDAEVKAIKTVEKHKEILDLIVEELIEKETIVLEEINYINKFKKRPPKRDNKKVVAEQVQSLDEIINEMNTRNNKRVIKDVENDDDQSIGSLPAPEEAKAKDAKVDQKESNKPKDN